MQHSSGDIRGVKEIRDAAAEAKPRLFFEYCKNIIRERENGKISVEDAGYRIAGLMFVRELDSPLFEEITLLAGRLELPAYISGSDPAADWKKLVALVNEYGAQI